MRWQEFRQCPGCGFDFATGEGEKGCHYYECPYLPPELQVMCDECRYDFFSEEGNPECADPTACERGAEAREHVVSMRTWLQRIGR